MHRFPAALLACAAAAVFVSLLLLLLLPPVPLLEAAASRLAPSARWEALDREGTRPAARDLVLPAGPAALHAGGARLTHSAARGLVTGVWDFELRHVRVVPTDTRLPSVAFASGRGRWIARERRLELRDWVSPELKMEADLGWNRAGRIGRARIAGDADPAELRKALSAWKELSGSDLLSDRLSFELKYEKGKLFITVNGKPFFRAAWQSDGAF